jgi:UDP-glucose 4-epimerase
VHLAAAVGVKLIVERPVHTIETNIGGAEAVLKAALRYGARVVLASTSEVYGKGARLPFREDDDVLLGPTSRSRWAYAASKMVDEFLGLAYAREFGLDTVIVRFFNTVGPRQTGRYGMVVPTLVRQAVRGEKLTVFGDGTQSRAFCHVADVVEAVCRILPAREASGQVYNVGGSEEISIRELAERIARRAGSSSTVELIPYEQAYAEGFEDMRRRVPDTSKLERLVGWRPERTLDQILDDVIAYERARA